MLTINLRTYFITFFLFFTVIFTINSQTNFNKNYTVKDGLAHDITYQMIKDSLGYIYIGTDNGISIFDGTNFRNIENKNGSNYVIDFFEDNNNSLYFCTWGSGLHKLNEITNEIKTYKNIPPKISGIKPINSELIYVNNYNSNFSIYNTKKEKVKRFFLYKRTEKKYFLDTKVTTEFPHFETEEIILDNEIIIIADYKFREHELDQIFAYNIESKKLKRIFPFINQPIHSFYKKDNRYFLSSKNNILIVENNKIIQNISLPELNEKNIYELRIHKGILYFLVFDINAGERKFYSYNPNSKELHCISDTIGISSMISDYLIDSYENIWISTYGEGIFHYKNSKNKFFGKDVFTEKELKDIKYYDGAYLILSPNNLYEFKNNEVTSKISVPYNGEKFQIIPKKSQIDILSKNYYNKKYKNLNIKNRESKSFVFEYKNQQIKILFNEVKVYQNNKLIQTFFKNRSNRINNAQIRDNILYILFEFDGLITVDLNTNQITNKWSKLSNSKNPKFIDFLLKNDEIWIGTTKGLFKIKEEKILNINGLLNENINDIAIDQYGIIWVGNQSGLNLIKNDKAYGIGENSSQNSSIVSNILVHDQKVFVTGNNGLFIYQNDNEFIPKNNFDLYIEQKHNTFHFKKINILNLHDYIIQYKLNQSKEWKTIENDLSKIDFKDLDAGYHEIEFRYRELSGDWKHSNPFYFKNDYSIYFKSIPVLITFILIAVSLYYHKKRKLDKSIDQNSELKDELSSVRKDIAQDFHDELGNKIANISLLSSMLERETDNEKSKRKIQKIRTESTDLYENVKNMIWLFNDEEQSFNDVFFYLKDFGENLFENSEIQFHSEIEETNFTYDSVFFVKQIMFIFKEAMTNVLKHSNAKNIYFNVRNNKNSILIECKDDGNGFDKMNLKRQNGLINMKNRSQKLTANLKVNSILKKGTSIKLEIELNKIKVLNN
ncbi:histidine kinase [Aureivirga sp. CE67]|uniref:sensor histidine kinase n=1 Tax=Aureivirga sp. CE67 TaxID=1788983 RepID=UPI0018CA0479|nr:histidine kinase [Aureivirga sp. CE67]